RERGHVKGAGRHRRRGAASPGPAAGCRGPAAWPDARRRRSFATYLLAKASGGRENRPVEHLSRERLMAGLGQVRSSPHDGGRLVLLVRRPAVGERDMPAEAVIGKAGGLDGDNWLARGSKGTPDGSADPHRQITVMNARVAELVAGGTSRM